MPELAEVEFYRHQWDPGLGQRILRVELHGEKRIFRGTNPDSLRDALSQLRLVQSESRGKQMVFRFERGAWLGIHLGMTGKLRVENPSFHAGKHDHLALVQKKQVLVFEDPRQFGRVHFYQGKGIPDWWKKLPPSINSKAFTRAALQNFLDRHPKLPLKAALLLQDGFPGVGNWMADEILWQSALHPAIPCAQLNKTEITTLWKKTRKICRVAMEKIGKDFSDPPRGWLFHERWSRKGKCPQHRHPLTRETIGGRTTAWCEKCQVQGSPAP